MKFQDAAAFRRALEKQMEEQAGGDKLRLAQLARNIAFERLLARLGSVAPAHCVAIPLALEHRYGQIPTETVWTEGLLGFAGIEPVEAEAVPLELQVAEKVYEYTCAYEHVVESSGVEDLFDLSAIAGRSGLNPVFLRETIGRVFEMNNADLPEELHRPPVEWAVPFGRLAEAAGAGDELATGHQAAAAFLDPVLSGKATAGIWNAARRQWVGGSSNGHHPS